MMEEEMSGGLSKGETTREFVLSGLRRAAAQPRQSS